MFLVAKKTKEPRRPFRSPWPKKNAAENGPLFSANVPRVERGDVSLSRALFLPPRGAVRKRIAWAFHFFAKGALRRERKMASGWWERNRTE
jgi:hypothetical protein